MITVDEIMTTEVYTLTPDHSLLDARNLMHEKRIRHIPIVNGVEKVIGLITQTDLLRSAVSSRADLNEAERESLESEVMIREIMNPNIRTVSPRDDLKTTAKKMQAMKFGCMPVIDNDKLVGLVTDTDYVAVAINLLEQIENWEVEEDTLAD